MWRRLEHPNIVSLFGITIAPPPPQLISDWIVGENLMEYINDHPGANRLGLVCTLLHLMVNALTASKLSGIASGLEYLHSNDVVHGDLRGVRYCP